jgi:hypothetical protein
VQEILALIAAKRESFLEELDVVDGRDLMNPDASKWICISQEVMRAGFSPCLRDGPACKTKWNQLIPDYKRIADYHSKIGRNVADYWEQTATEHKAEGLPKAFMKEFYDAIHKWYGNRPQIQPPHVRDLLALDDGNFRREQQHAGFDDEQHADNEPETDDPIEASESDRVGSQIPVPIGGNTAVSNLRPASRLPAGVTPFVLSTSDTSEFCKKIRPGNTGIHRKNVLGHNVIAEAIRASGEVMGSQMRDMAEFSRELERNKIEVQLKLFTEQMAYQREKDRRLYENAVIANENARLAILKQGEVVSCLAQLSSVLSKGLFVSTDGDICGMPQAASPDVAKTFPRSSSTNKRNRTLNGPSSPVPAADPCDSPGHLQ